MNSEGVLSALAASPKKKLIILLAVTGAVLLLAGALFSGSKKEDSGGAAAVDSEDMIAYARSLEDRIVKLCEEVDGVSDVSVLLTLDGGTERVYAENETGGSYVVISAGGEERVVLVREIYSSVRGIGVVCRGGDKIAVQKKLTELLSCALGVPISKISVAGKG